MQDKTLIFGAPGCGKTRKLMDILADELREVSPERIALVTFTKKGAEEAKTRAMGIFSYPESAYKYFRTIHSLCFRELRMSRYDMMAAKDYKVFSDAMGMKFLGYYTEDFYHSDDRYLHLYLLRQNNIIAYDKALESMDVDMRTFRVVESNYERYKKQLGKRDYTDLLADVVRKQISIDVDVAIIDEAQDLTTLQWEACNMLFKNAKRVYIAGDDDQAIYEWTGSDVEYFLGIDGKRIILDKSWRMKSNLLDFSKKITGAIRHRVDKIYAPLENGGNIYWHNTVADFKFNKDETYYCLARNNYHLQQYTHELKKQGLVFTVKDRASISPSMADAINDFDMFKTGLLDERRKINVMQYLRRDIKNINTLRWDEALSITADEAIYYSLLIKNKADLKNKNILVSTIHGVIGGEADNVILLMDVTKTVYSYLDKLTDSELRCLYVACTRAKTNLHIISANTKYSYSPMFDYIGAKETR